MTDSKVLLVRDVEQRVLVQLLERYGLVLEIEEGSAPITGSFWGDTEAGIVGRTVYVRRETPIHSLLHETCHIICMTGDRRDTLARDVGGDDLEESAVCYLQLVLADQIEDVGRDRLMLDMDEWGYSFRLGSTADWFQNDAEVAEQFLINHKLLSEVGAPVYGLRA